MFPNIYFIMFSKAIDHLDVNKKLAEKNIYWFNFCVNMNNIVLDVKKVESTVEII